MGSTRRPSTVFKSEERVPNHLEVDDLLVKELAALRSKARKLNERSAEFATGRDC